MSYSMTGNTSADDRTRLLARFAPPVAAPSAPAYPAPPAPAASSAMATPSYAPQAAAQAPPIPAPPAQPQGGFGSSLGTWAHQNAAPDPFGDLDPGNRKALDDYYNSLAGIDYKGSHESALMQRAALAQLLRSQEAEGPVDYTSAAPIADQYRHAGDRLSAMLAARGLNGGVVAGAQSNLQGQQAGAVGEYIRKLLSERQAQHHSDMQRFLDWTRQLNGMGLQQNIQEQNHKGGFLKDLLGVAGTIGGALIGGPAGAGVGAATGAFSNSSQGGSAGYGNASMGGYGPPDEEDYYGPWQGQAGGL